MSSKGAGWGPLSSGVSRLFFVPYSGRVRENRWIQVSPVCFLRPTVGGYGKTDGYRCLPSIFCVQPLAGTVKPLDTDVSRPFFAPNRWRVRENCWIQVSPIHFLRPKNKNRREQVFSRYLSRPSVSKYVVKPYGKGYSQKFFPYHAVPPHQ